MPKRCSKQFVDPDMLHPAFRMVGTGVHAHASKGKLDAHDHGPAHEICLIERGVAHWWVEDESYELTAGQVFITRPGERHGAVDGILGPCVVSWLIIDFTRAEPRAIIDSFLDRAPRRCLAPEIRDCFQRLLNEHDCPDALSTDIAWATVVNMLAIILRSNADSQLNETLPLSPEIKRAANLISHKLDTIVSIDELAGHAELGRRLLHQRFLQETGHTPGSYRNYLRIEKAKDLLVTTNRPVTAIALDLGFPSSQHFATMFKQYTATTPSAYRTQTERLQ